MTELRNRILVEFRKEGPKVARVMNVGALEEALWTEDEWQDDYADDLQDELDELVDEEVLVRLGVLDEPAYMLAGPVKTDAETA